MKYFDISTPCGTFSNTNLYELFYMLDLVSFGRNSELQLYYLTWKKKCMISDELCTVLCENFSTDTSSEQKGFVPQVLTHEVSIDFRCGEALPFSSTICKCI